MGQAPSRQAVLRFIDAEIAAGRPFPSSAAIKAHMNWKNETSATDCLSRLCFERRIRRVGRGRWERVG
jgi:hypothetical protein